MTLRAVTDADVPAILAKLGARRLSDIDPGAPPPLTVGRLYPLGHTILYGTGGAGKGVVTAEWIVRLVREGHRVLIVDYENHPDEWARRIESLGGADVAAAVIHVAPLTAAWGGRKGPLWKQAADLRELAELVGATVIVIDSIVVACAGSDPTKPETPSVYAGALEFIGRPALSIAHVTRAHDDRYPFGSVFWHNLARVTWSLKRDGEAGTALLVNRKANNYAHAGRFVVTTTWLDDRPGEVWERPYAAVLAERIAEALGADALPVAEIVTALNDEVEDGDRVKADSVRAALRRGAKGPDPRLTVTDDRWSLIP